MAKNGIDTFKMLYVLAIFMIVDGHIGHFDYLDLGGLLRYQNYHTALFMFVSGYFLNLERGYKAFFARKTAKILVPLYLWNLVYGGVCFLLNRYGGFSLGGAFSAYNLLIAPFTDGHQFIYNMGAWFLVPLFLVQCIGFLALKPLADEKGRLNGVIAGGFFWVMFGLGCLALMAAPENNAARTFYLTLLRVAYFLPCFALGVWYRAVLEKYDVLKTGVRSVALLFLIAVLCYAYPNYNHIPAWLDYVGEPALVIYLISFTAILFWLGVARFLAPLLQKSRVLCYLSEHTFDIMMHHFAGFMLIKAALSGGDGFDKAAFKSDIWYYYFWGREDLSQWLYIVITIVIALLIGFTSRKIGGIILKTVHFERVLEFGRRSDEKL